MYMETHMHMNVRMRAFANKELIIIVLKTMAYFKRLNSAHLGRWETEWVLILSFN